MSDRLKTHLQTLPAFELDALRLDRWNEVATVAGQFNADTETIRRLLQEIRPKHKADRFEWLQAVCQRHDIGVRALRTAVAIFSFAGDTGYIWPSQRSLAHRAGYGDDAEIRRGLASLVAIGAIRKLRIVNMPEQLAEAALTSAKNGGSGRSARGTAYALTPPADWSKKCNTGTLCPSADRDTVSLLNLQGKPQQASPDVSSYSGASTINIEYAESSVMGNDRRKARG
ncbi:hypothetical protein [Rhizobium mayense]|uniref:hypothetical protein n=1 Tax=Rhizobium mayense TaxID=1312184 RepID=UPI00398C3829